MVWDNLRLEAGDAPALALANHPELRSAIETACGLRFGQHPQGRAVPPTALVTEAGSEVRIDLKKLPEPLLKQLALPRLLRADVSLDAGSPESAMELGPCLEPLAPWRERMVFIRGLWHEQANNGIIHCMQTGNMLSGSTMAKNEVHTGVSFDQVMARQIGERTRLPSLVLGCEEAVPGLQDGHPLLYGSHISWSSPVSLPTRSRTS